MTICANKSRDIDTGVVAELPTIVVLIDVIWDSRVY